MKNNTENNQKIQTTWDILEKASGGNTLIDAVVSPSEDGTGFKVVIDGCINKYMPKHVAHGQELQGPVQLLVKEARRPQDGQPQVLLLAVPRKQNTAAPSTTSSGQPSQTKPVGAPSTSNNAPSGQAPQPKPVSGTSTNNNSPSGQVPQPKPVSAPKPYQQVTVGNPLVVTTLYKPGQILTVDGTSAIADGSGDYTVTTAEGFKATIGKGEVTAADQSDHSKLICRPELTLVVLGVNQMTGAIRLSLMRLPLFEKKGKALAGVVISSGSGGGKHTGMHTNGRNDNRNNLPRDTEVEIQSSNGSILRVVCPPKLDIAHVAAGTEVYVRVNDPLLERFTPFVTAELRGPVTASASPNSHRRERLSPEKLAEAGQKAAKKSSGGADKAKKDKEQESSGKGDKNKGGGGNNKKGK